MAKKNFYVVLKGRKPGIYNSWPECEAQVKGFSGASYKGVSTYDQAYELFHGVKPKKNDPILKKQNLDTTFATERCIYVDAACSGNPGPAEFRYLWSDTGEVIYHSSKFNATNNIAEFLGIVDALMFVKENNLDVDIFTDSKSGLSWVFNKKIKTSYEWEKDPRLSRAIMKCLDFLEKNEKYPRLRKWNTALQGEIPADFGRK